MAQFVTWGSWTATSIAAATITNGSSASTAAIPLNNKVAAQVGVTLTYGATKNQSVKVYIRENVNGNDETLENAFPFTVEGAASESHYRMIAIPSTDYVDPIITITNDSGASVTAVSVHYRNSEIGSS